jgi:CubicO group peptidase (beta-lactamase class C family)
MGETKAFGEPLIAPVETHGETHALLVQHKGEMLYEAYGSGYATPCGPGNTYISWSMAKSMTHALVGMLVKDGLVDVAAPAPVPEWQGSPRAAITWQDLLDMHSGLEWVEDYVDGDNSHVIDMLFGKGVADHGAYAAALPLATPIGTTWNYSSGTTNILCRCIGDILCRGLVDATAQERAECFLHFLSTRLFEPLGMTSAIAKCDDAGNFVGSSYVYATARDFLKFGELYMNGGSVVSDGARRQLLPNNWVNHARTVVANDEVTGTQYGAHWWVWPQCENSLVATGYEGQYLAIIPEKELVMVRLGKTDTSLRSAVQQQLQRIAQKVTNI